MDLLTNAGTPGKCALAPKINPESVAVIGARMDCPVQFTVDCYVASEILFAAPNVVAGIGRHINANATFSTGDLHATFCGSRRWATASGDPVGAQQWASLPRSCRRRGPAADRAPGRLINARPKM
jgi:hypothetical protein